MWTLQLASEARARAPFVFGVPSTCGRCTQDAGERGCAGVTTGQLFCACVGSPARAEYSVFGDAANLAARLMSKAASGDHGQVLCDFRTRDTAKEVVSFVQLEPMEFKVRDRPCTGQRGSSAGCNYQRIIIALGGGGMVQSRNHMSCDDLSDMITYLRFSL